MFNKRRDKMTRWKKSRTMKILKRRSLIFLKLKFGGYKEINLCRRQIMPLRIKTLNIGNWALANCFLIGSRIILGNRKIEQLLSEMEINQLKFHIDLSAIFLE